MLLCTYKKKGKTECIVTVAVGETDVGGHQEKKNYGIECKLTNRQMMPSVERQQLASWK